MTAFVARNLVLWRAVSGIFKVAAEFGALVLRRTSFVTHGLIAGLILSSVLSTCSALHVNSRQSSIISTS